MMIGPIESFLDYIEKNEKHVFQNCLDDAIYPIIPFYQLVYVLNVEDTIKELIDIDKQFNSKLIRVDGYLTAVMAEENYQKKEFTNSVIHILKMMRF
ncbi:hypothetical protein [Providencia sneebia]|uniref:Uncharacterized protein n=1 Tax=Providencia sneebia DSM 19967 TaxID=1141660 RepID=K8WV56_9GAMM|nr:hypothetical protein [Providencia sneebia]EKT60080.1 hypothetical protein OO7_04594 [Providencia sneebia DSM 19967]